MQAQGPAEIPTIIVENSQISESHGANLEASRSFFGSHGAKLGTGIFLQSYGAICLRPRLCLRLQCALVLLSEAMVQISLKVDSGSCQELFCFSLCSN